MNGDFEKAWRQSLKAGDRVVITEKGMSRRKRIVTVERVTATQIIVSDRGRRFNKQYGREVGTSYGPAITPVTELDLQHIRADKNRSDFASLIYRPERLSDEEIAAMLKAVSEVRASKAGESK